MSLNTNALASRKYFLFKKILQGSMPFGDPGPRVLRTCSVNTQEQLYGGFVGLKLCVFETLQLAQVST